MKLFKYAVIGGIIWYLWDKYEAGSGGAFGQPAFPRVGRKPGTRPGAGPGGLCVCPACGATVPHEWNVACYDTTCPKCSSRMTR